MKNNENKFEKLEAWQKSHALVLEIYKITKTFPENEQYRLVNQLCRAVSSVAANIVEGNSRNSAKEFKQFAFQARGSLEEVKYHLLLAKDLGYLSEAKYNNLIVQANKVGALLSGLIKYLKSRVLVSKV